MISQISLPKPVTSARATARTAQSEALRTRQAFHAEFQAFIQNVATPLFRQTANHEEYAAMLLGLMRSAGLEITRFHLVKNDHSSPVGPNDYALRNFLDEIPRDYFAQGGGRDVYRFVKEFTTVYPSETNDRAFATCHSMWATRGCSNPSYIIWVEGKDPDGILSIFSELLYLELQQTAHTVWAAQR